MIIKLNMIKFEKSFPSVKKGNLYKTNVSPQNEESYNVLGMVNYL